MRILARVTCAVAAAAVASCMPRPRLVPVTPNPESACRFEREVADGGSRTFPPLSFSPDGRYLVASSDPGASDRPVVDGAIWIYDLDRVSRRPLQAHGPAHGGYYYARWSPTGRSIAVASADRIEVVSPEGGAVVARFGAPLGVEITRLAWSADATTLAVAGTGGVVFFLDVESGTRRDGDVCPTRVVQIESEGDGFLVYHEAGEELLRSFMAPARKTQRRPKLTVRNPGTLNMLDRQEVVVHDEELGARLVSRSQEHLMLPGVRGDGSDIIVNAEGFTLSRDRKRLAFAKVVCGQVGCSGTLRVMQCTGLPIAP